MTRLRQGYGGQGRKEIMGTEKRVVKLEPREKVQWALPWDGKEYEMRMGMGRLMRFAAAAKEGDLQGVVENLRHIVPGLQVDDLDAADVVMISTGIFNSIAEVARQAKNG